MKTNIYAVLTGDLIKSSKLTSELSAMAMQWLRDAADKFKALHPESILGELDTFRHDSWQMLMAHSALSLRAAVYLRASLKLHSGGGAKFDSRISIGIGEVEKIAESRISDSRGPAFTISGKNLDMMDRVRMMYAMQSGDQFAFTMLGLVAVPLLDCVVTDWTPKEARAVYGSLEGLTQEMIAEMSPPNPQTGKPVTRQAIADSLDRGHWGVVESVLNTVENKSKLSSLL